jgi:hypothetical protein
MEEWKTWLHAFLTSGAKWSISKPSLFKPTEEAPAPVTEEAVEGAEPVCTPWRRENFPVPPEIELWSSSSQPRHCIDWAVLAPVKIEGDK